MAYIDFVLVNILHLYKRNVKAVFIVDRHIWLCFSLLKSAEPLPQHTFEIDAEPEDKGDEVNISVSIRDV